jgi:hypothetical protein
MRSAGLTLPLAGTVATALSLGLTFAGLAHQARAANDSRSTGPRCGPWSPWRPR